MYVGKQGSGRQKKGDKAMERRKEDENEKARLEGGKLQVRGAVDLCQMLESLEIYV